MSKYVPKTSTEIKKEWDIVDDNEIQTKEDKEKRKKAEEYVHSSYDNFLFHYKNGFEALQKDIKDCKKLEIHSYSSDFIWFFFLGILSYKTSSNWNKIITDERSLYNSFKKELITKDINDFIDAKKIKDQYSLYFRFKDILPKEDYTLLDLIKIDVNRTFQKIQLFHLDKIKKILVTALFIFAKKYKDISYRQGMSELCAVFLYVLYKEQVIKPAFIENNEKFLFFLFHSNNEFLENDTYLMFSKFMVKGFAIFFKYNDEIYRDGYLNQLDIEQKKALTKKEIINSNDSDLKKRIFLIFYDKFPFIDKDLYKFMSDKIDPEIFIFRWFLCIFTREFPINQVVHLWDLILLYEYVEGKLSKKDSEIDNNENINIIDNSNNNNIINNNNNNIKNENDNDQNQSMGYNFIDYIALSMILKIKNLIVKKKTSSELLSFLMKYPTDIDLKEICQKALDIYYKINPNIKV